MWVFGVWVRAVEDGLGICFNPSLYLMEINGQICGLLTAHSVLFQVVTTADVSECMLGECSEEFKISIFLYKISIQNQNSK